MWIETVRTRSGLWALVHSGCPVCVTTSLHAHRVPGEGDSLDPTPVWPIPDSVILHEIRT